MNGTERQEGSPQSDYISQKIFEYIRLVKGEGRLEELAIADPEAQRELAELRCEATADGLTRLPDRRFFFRYLLPGLRAKGSRKCRCIRVDLDNLKDFNRTEIWGDGGGDAVVAATSVILRALAEEFSAIPVRFHGDTFMLVFEGLPGVSKVVSSGARHLQQVDGEALIQGQVLGRSLKDYSEDPPGDIRLSRDGLQKLKAIADGQYADLLLPVRTTFTILSLDPSQDHEQIKSVLQTADDRCSKKKKIIMRQLKKEYPKGFPHLLRKE